MSSHRCRVTALAAKHHWMSGNRTCLAPAVVRPLHSGRHALGKYDFFNRTQLPYSYGKRSAPEDSEKVMMHHDVYGRPICYVDRQVSHDERGRVFKAGAIERNEIAQKVSRELREELMPLDSSTRQKLAVVPTVQGHPVDIRDNDEKWAAISYVGLSPIRYKSFIEDKHSELQLKSTAGRHSNLSHPLSDSQLSRQQPSNLSLSLNSVYAKGFQESQNRLLPIKWKPKKRLTDADETAVQRMDDVHGLSRQTDLELLSASQVALSDQLRWIREMKQKPVTQSDNAAHFKPLKFEFPQAQGRSPSVQTTEEETARDNIKRAFSTNALKTLSKRKLDADMEIAQQQQQHANCTQANVALMQKPLNADRERENCDAAEQPADKYKESAASHCKPLRGAVEKRQQQQREPIEFEVRSVKKELPHFYKNIGGGKQTSQQAKALPKVKEAAKNQFKLRIFDKSASNPTVNPATRPKLLFQFKEPHPIQYRNAVKKVVEDEPENDYIESKKDEDNYDSSDDEENYHNKMESKKPQQAPNESKSRYYDSDRSDRSYAQSSNSMRSEWECQDETYNPPQYERQQQYDRRRR